MSHIKNIEIYAKTGTAQVSSLELRNKDNKFSEHGWLVAYFRYKDFEPLTMVVIAEHSDRSTVATIIAKNFLVAYQTYCQEQQSVL